MCVRGGGGERERDGITPGERREDQIFVRGRDKFV